MVVGRGEDAAVVVLPSIDIEDVDVWIIENAFIK
jgi:hypothetical protein